MIHQANGGYLSQTTNLSILLLQSLLSEELQPEITNPQDAHQYCTADDDNPRSTYPHCHHIASFSTQIEGSHFVEEPGP